MITGTPSDMSNGKLIAKNTVFLYIRMLFIMGITLFTSRVILAALGISDYGIYNVVGGLATSFVFFSSSLSNATQRFLTFALGKNDIAEVRNVFNLSLLVYAIIAILVFVIGEIAGMYLIYNHLIIPDDRLPAAIWVFHATMLSLSVTLVSTVFDSVLIARENMKIYAYIGMLEAVVRLSIAYILKISPTDKLILYATLLLIFSVLIKTIPVIYCLRQYPECHIGFFWDKKQFTKMLSFVGWNGLGTFAWTINEQGVNVLLNMFFGPVVNAARGVAGQVSAAVNNFSRNFFTAVRPQIVKSYATEDYSYFVKLIFYSSRFSFFLMWMLCLPILLRRDYILNLWLKEVPEWSQIFLVWVLIYSLVNVLTQPTWAAIQAIGELKHYILIGSGIYLLSFPISYIFLKLGFSPILPFQVLVIIRVIYLAIVLQITRHYVKFSVVDYIKSVLIPIFFVIIISYAIGCYTNTHLPPSFCGLLEVLCTTTIVILIAVFFAGLTPEERNFTLTHINNVIKKFKK